MIRDYKPVLSEACLRTDYETKQDNLKMDQNLLKKELTRINERKIHQKEECKEFLTKNKELKSYLGESTSKIEQLSSELKDVIIQHDIQKEESLRLEEMISDQSNRLRESEVQGDNLLRKLTEAQMHQTQVTDQAHHSANELAQSNARIAELAQTNNDLSHQVTELNSLNQFLQAELLKKQNQQDEQDANLLKAQRDLIDHQAQTEESTLQEESKLIEYDNIKEQVEKVKDSFQKNHLNLQHLASKLNSSHSEKAKSKKVSEDKSTVASEYECSVNEPTDLQKQFNRQHSKQFEDKRESKPSHSKSFNDNTINTKTHCNDNANSQNNCIIVGKMHHTRKQQNVKQGDMQTTTTTFTHSEFPSAKSRLENEFKFNPVPAHSANGSSPQVNHQSKPQQNQIDKELLEKMLKVNEEIGEQEGKICNQMHNLKERLSQFEQDQQASQLQMSKHMQSDMRHLFGKIQLVMDKYEQAKVELHKYKQDDIKGINAVKLCELRNKNRTMEDLMGFVKKHMLGRNDARKLKDLLAQHGIVLSQY